MLLMGVGVNDADYAVTRYENGKQVWACPAYTRWRSMLHRCSSKGKLLHPSYDCVTLDPRWEKFSEFKKWYDVNVFENCYLDKDILGGNVYGPDTCIMVPREVNNAASFAGCKGVLPLGVRYARRKYQARICFGKDVRLFLGSFSTAEQAHQAWQKAKIARIEEVVGIWQESTTYNSVAGRKLLDMAGKIRRDLLLGIETKDFGGVFC